MKWLIVEDALKNKQGHWFEYIETFRTGLKDLGHEVHVLAEQNADSFIAELEDVFPVLPDSIWHRMSDSASRLQRYLRVPQHAMQTRSCVKRWLSEHPTPDVIFVPTVLVHHLLGWWRIFRERLERTKTRLVLFFPNTPIKFDNSSQTATFGGDPTSRLFLWLIRRLETWVRSGQVVLGVETFAMRDGMTRVTGVPFTYLPHPVNLVAQAPSPNPRVSPLVFGCYGAARHEKGSDILQEAIKLHLKAFPDSTSQFHFQWLSGYTDQNGTRHDIDESLATDQRVRFIRDFFAPGEYEKQIALTDVMLLPYRDPYRFRVSRVVIEALVASMPVVATRGTTLWEQSSEFGSAIPCELDDPQSLADAIHQAETSFEFLRRVAVARTAAAKEHFSVSGFVSLLANSRLVSGHQT